MNYTEEALRFRLDALSCPLPLPPQHFTDALHIQKLISWLEDTHIRLLPIPDRVTLRRPLSHFLPALHAYLARLPHLPHAPVRPSSPSSASSAALLPTLAYLTDVALALHYADNASSLSTPRDPWYGHSVPVIPDASNSSHVHSAVCHLLSTLDLSVSTLSTVTDVSVNDGLDVVADRVEQLCKGPFKPAAMQMVQHCQAGLSTGDPVIDRVASVARVLLVRRLRMLQDDINDTIAGIQAVTADPKTNSRLGQVGR